MSSSTASTSSDSNNNPGGTTNPRDPSGYITSPPSTVVKVVGTARDDINGLLGIVVSYNVERERYLVFMPVSQSTMALKVQNLAKGSTMEKYRAQFQQLQNDPRVREKVAHYIKMAQKYVKPLKLSHAVGGGFMALSPLVYLFGFTRTLLVMSTCMLLGVISGPDILAKRPLKAILLNFPNRANETLCKQLPFLKGKLTNKMALGIVLLLVGFTCQSLFLNGDHGTTKTNQYDTSSSTSRRTATTTTTTQPSSSSLSSILNREMIQKYYKMGYDDATNGLDHGSSIQDELQQLLVLEEKEAELAGIGIDIPMSEMIDGEIVMSSNSDVDGIDELYSQQPQPPPPPTKKSIVSKLANFSTLGSLLYVYRIMKEKGTEPSTGLFSLGQLAANLQHHTELWQQGILLFSLYNLFRIFFS